MPVLKLKRFDVIQNDTDEKSNTPGSITANDTSKAQNISTSKMSQTDSNRKKLANLVIDFRTGIKTSNQQRQPAIGVALGVDPDQNQDLLSDL